MIESHLALTLNTEEMELGGIHGRSTRRNADFHFRFKNISFLTFRRTKRLHSLLRGYVPKITMKGTICALVYNPIFFRDIAY